MIDGVLLTERGEYTFMTRRFTIKRGSATFINSAELNPTLQGVAEYEVRQPNREAINIQIVVGGTLNTPNISLTSDAQPPINQSDLLSYLAFGQESSSLLQLEGTGLTNGGTGQNIVGAGAALATQQLAGGARCGGRSDRRLGGALAGGGRVYDHSGGRADGCRKFPARDAVRVREVFQGAHLRGNKIPARSAGVAAAGCTGRAQVWWVARISAGDGRGHALSPA